MSGQAHVVVVADPLLGDLLAEECRLMGISAARAASVAEAVTAAAQKHLDIAVVDALYLEAADARVDALARVLPTIVIDRGNAPPAPAAVRLVPVTAGLGGLLEAMESLLGRQLRQVIDDSRTHVVVVDDTAEIRVLLADFLTEKDYRVSTRNDGREFLDALDEGLELDVCLLDLQMPRAGGMEVLEGIRERRLEVNVIMMTAVADREVARMALEAGAFDYIVKPVDLGTVESSIVACLSHQEYRRKKWWKIFGP